jgi:hypothetical protein
MFGAFGMRLDGVVGHDAGNQWLLMQRGAVDSSLTSKSYEAGSDDGSKNGHDDESDSLKVTFP